MKDAADEKEPPRIAPIPLTCSTRQGQARVAYLPKS